MNTTWPPSADPLVSEKLRKINRDNEATMPPLEGTEEPGPVPVPPDGSEEPGPCAGDGGGNGDGGEDVAGRRTRRPDAALRALATALATGRPEKSRLRRTCFPHAAAAARRRLRLLDPRRGYVPLVVEVNSVHSVGIWGSESLPC